MPGNIWVLAEQWRGRVSEITYEALALGAELAGGLGVRLEAVLLGQGVKQLAASLGKAGNVLYVDHPALAEPVADSQAEALTALVRARQPAAILVPLTNVSLGVGTLLAARLGLPAINFCRDVAIECGRIRAGCVLYGGKIEAVAAPASEPVVLGLWPGARPADQGRAAGAPPVEEVALELAEPVIKLKRYIEPEAGDVDIAQKDVLIAVGRGIQSRENIELAEELAAALDGAVCGSRPVIDQGWLPMSRQVGKSGVTVKPKLYIALGISGAPEHVEGMKDAGLIVAVNSDPRAPIFGVAHYGIVADALDVIPALKDTVEALRGQAA